MKNSLLLFLVLYFSKEILSDEPEAQPKLNIGVYFESLCPDSYKFIKEQLQPNFKHLSSNVNLKLVPFGKSSSVENGSFICHHGPPECKGNKIISCAINKLSDQNKQVEFTECFMTTFKVDRNNEEEYGQKCALTVGLEPDDILKCYNSEEGTNYQLVAEKDTLSVLNSTLKSVPTIVFNEEFNQDLHQKSLDDFKSVTCSQIINSPPEACQISPVVPL